METELHKLEREVYSSISCRNCGAEQGGAQSLNYEELALSVFNQGWRVRRENVFCEKCLENPNLK